DGCAIEAERRLSIRYLASAERPERRHDERDDVGQGQLPGERRRPVSGEQRISLVDGREDRSYDDGDHAGSAKHRPVHEGAPETLPGEPLRRLELIRRPGAERLTAPSALLHGDLRRHLVARYDGASDEPPDSRGMAASATAMTQYWTMTTSESPKLYSNNPAT